MENKDAIVKETRIAELRLDNDLKQKDIAIILNVKENNYSKWERGVTDIPLNKSNELCNYYNCSLDYLFGLSNINDVLNINKDIDLELLSQRLLELRKEHNYTQEKISKDVGFHQRTYAHYEDGSRIPTTFKVFYIAVYYNVSFDYLVGKSNNKIIKNF